MALMTLWTETITFHGLPVGLLSTLGPSVLHSRITCLNVSAEAWLATVHSLSKQRVL